MVHEKSEYHKSFHHNHNRGGAVYFLGMVGALVYYLNSAPNFEAGLIGFLKALVWPAFLIHKVFTILGM